MSDSAGKKASVPAGASASAADAAGAAAATTAVPTHPLPPTIEALEEDDEFDEFKEENWTTNEMNVAAEEGWADDWDDEDADTDFDKVLRAELARVAAAAGEAK